MPMPLNAALSPACRRPVAETRRRCPRAISRTAAFTLIELLVVISIIALLVAILLPALGMARDSAHALNSLANTRSWGQGTHLFLQDYDHVLPWEGEQHAIVPTYPEDMWWGNAIPPYVNQPTYARLWAAAVSAGNRVPQPPDKNIFIDPVAEIGPEQLGSFTLDTLPYYFSYVWNASLADNLPEYEIDGLDRVRNDDIPQPSEAILMLELRSSTSELDFMRPADPGYSEKFETDQLRMKGDEKHLAGRHFQGGHLVYADGHATHKKFVESYDSPDWVID